jgi:hypothetical protein
MQKNTQQNIYKIKQGQQLYKYANINNTYSPKAKLNEWVWFMQDKTREEPIQVARILCDSRP